MTLKAEILRAHTHQDVCVFVIILPVRTNFTLTTDVPHIQFDALTLYCFDVEALKNFIGKNQKKLVYRWIQNTNGKMADKKGTTGKNLAYKSTKQYTGIS